MRRLFTFAIIPFLALCCSQNGTQEALTPDAVFTVDAGTFVSRDYVGNGVQWDPYENNYGNGYVTISDEDWDKLYSRLDFMKPGFIRVMGGASGTSSNDQLRRILDYCQSRGVTVMYGDWGGGLVNYDERKPVPERLSLAASNVHKLVTEDGYSCIKYYNLVNEPNGYWASTKGDMDLWLNSAELFCSDLAAEGSSLTLSAPDIAIWTDKETQWISSTRDRLDANVGVYDIHTYPSKITVNREDYTSIIKAYKDQVPEGKRAIMGEIGFKYIESADMDWEAMNRRMIAACPHASREDSQMMVFDHMYGTDMADALFQTMNCGYSGCVAWMLDDAMHSKEKPGMLKIWGFWNILGDEIFGSEQETVRPWYYAWSLLCRYIPSGCNVYSISREGDSSLKAVAIEKAGKRTLAFVNVGSEPKTVSVESSSLKAFKRSYKYSYTRDGLKTSGDHFLLPDSDNFKYAPGDVLEIPAESLILITEIHY